MVTNQQEVQTRYIDSSLAVNQLMKAMMTQATAPPISHRTRYIAHVEPLYAPALMMATYMTNKLMRIITFPSLDRIGRWLRWWGV